MRKNQLHNLPIMKKHRRELKKRPTPTEALLWERLRRKQLDGIKFRRQHSIGYFIVDFYCSKYKLIIEVDGEIHNRPEVIEYDEERTLYLESFGMRVIRFTNKEVMESIDEVLDKIRESATSPPPLS